MNIQDAVSVYSSDPTYENICNDAFNPPLKLICDRNTKRMFLINGASADLTMDHMLSEAWYVVRNQ